MRSRTARPALVVALVLATAGTAAAAPNNNNPQKLRQAVTVEGVLDHLRAFQGIADAAGGNRFAGLPGHQRSAAYVADTLRAAGYSPQLVPFTYTAFFEETPSRVLQLSPEQREYVNGNDFRVMSYSGSGDVSAPLARPSGDVRGCYASDWAGFPAGAIALVQRGTPTGFPGGSCTFRIKVENATKAGAAAALVYNNTAGVLNGTLSEGALSGIPALGLTKALGEALLAQGPTQMRVVTDTDSRALETVNVIAETATGDDANVVMAGAHLDSVTTGPGINDNGSGSAALLETAVQMAKVKPRNTVRFAWWSAEESGLVGARRYVASLSQAQKDAIALYLNFDMVGSPNFVRFVYDGDGSADPASIPVGCKDRCRPGSAVVEDAFTSYFTSAGLPVEATPFNGRSDYGPFIEADIPAGGLFTGAEGIKTAQQAEVFGGTAGQAYDSCYHAACDDIGNVSRTALDQMSDALATVLLQFAQSTESVNGAKGKGGYGPSAPASEPTGAGGGGGLHDEDHEPTDS